MNGLLQEQSDLGLQISQTYHSEYLGSLRKVENLLLFNPLLTNGRSHSYRLDEFTFSFRGIRSDFSFSFNFLMKFM